MKAYSERRFGRFSIPMRMFHKAPDEVADALAMVIVLRADYSHELDAIEYTAVSEFFDQVPKGARSHEYVAEFCDGEFSKWVRVDKGGKNAGS